ncbi:hypothetical protein MBLNU230_g0187t1 [Neophaeotheca triangularis]
MPSNALPPLQALTPNDRGAIVVVHSYCFAGFTVVAAITRVLITIKTKQGFHKDDIAFLSSVGFAILTSILVERAVDDGLGRHQDTLTSSNLSSFYDLTYTSSMLSIVAMSLAKASVVLLYERIAPRQDGRGVAILSVSVGFFALFSLLVQGLQCGATTVYHPDQCSTNGVLQYCIIVLNIITDILLSVWMIPRIWSLQASLRQRTVPCILFGLRLIVCVMALCQLIVVSRHLQAEDQTWGQTASWTLAIVVVHLSVITSTLPRINSFIADVQTGQIGLRITSRDIELMDKSRSGQLSNSGNNSQNQSKQMTGDKHISLRPDRRAQNTQANQIYSKTREHSDDISPDHARDGIETSSQSSLNRNAVWQTTEFRWEEERLPGPSSRGHD